MIELGALTEIKTGRLDANASVDDGQYPFFTCSKEALRIDKYSFDGDYVLVAGNGDLNVKHYIGKFDAYQQTYAIKSNEDKLNSRYLYYFLSKYVDVLRNQSIGGVIKYIKIGNLTDAKIPLPPLAKQKQIAAILDAADSLRQKDLQLVEHYTALSQSLFLEMFGEPVSNPMVWPKIELGSLTKISSGSTPSRSNEDYYHGNIPWVKTTEVNGSDIFKTSECINEKALKESSCKLYPSGSLIIAMYGQGKTRGKVGRLMIEAATNQACAVIPPSERMNSHFLYSVLKLSYKDLRSLGRGGTQPNLNSGLIKSYNVIAPPLELQNQFAERVAIIEQQKQQAQTNLQKSEALFNSLLQRAFTGELTANKAA